MLNQETVVADIASLQSTDGQETFRLLPHVCYRIGRMPKAEILIKGSSASRLHAVVVHDGKRWILQDMSSNGTVVNRSPVMPRHALQPGDVIRFGEVSEWVFMQRDGEPETCYAEETSFSEHQSEEGGGFNLLPVGNPLIVGTSSINSGLRFHAGKAAAKSVSVIIRGEQGAGKRHLARFIHARGQDRSKELQIADCRKLTARSIRKMFGSGGASLDVGTIILEEFLRLPLDAQEALFQYFQDLSTLRSSDNDVVGPRLVSITSASPEKAIDRGEFRSDLFFKLGVAQILVDPLRDHVDDIPELATHFGRMCAEQLRCRDREFAGSSIDLMQKYRWPGNLAELRNVVERAVMLAQGQFIERGDLVAGFSEMLRDGVPYAGFSLEQVEKEHIDATLTAQRWVKSHVAKTLGIERSTLDRKIAKYELSRGDRSIPEELATDSN